MGRSPVCGHAASEVHCGTLERRQLLIFSVGVLYAAIRLVKLRIGQHRRHLLGLLR